MNNRIGMEKLENPEMLPPPRAQSGHASHGATPAAGSEPSNSASEPPISMIQQIATSGAMHSDVVMSHRKTSARGLVTRVLAIVTLLMLLGSCGLMGRAVYRAMTDGWIAPLQLSPDSRDVLALRIQDSKERNTRERLESELAATHAEMEAISVGLERLQTLAGAYAGAVSWNTESRGNQLAALQRQRDILELRERLLNQTLSDEEEVFRRAQTQLASGLINRADLQRAQVAHQKAKAAVYEVELEKARVAAAIAEVQREQNALTKANPNGRHTTTRGDKAASPDVMRFDEVQVNIQLQLARLEAEKRTAVARERAATSEIASMDQLRRELDETPLFLAMQNKMDIAFVPYSHLKKLTIGDEVYDCTAFVFNCRVVGTVESIFPGEVVTEDPWRSLARGQYVKLSMIEPEALTEQALRVRPKRDSNAVPKVGAVPKNTGKKGS